MRQSHINAETQGFTPPTHLTKSVLGEWRAKPSAMLDLTRAAIEFGDSWLIGRNYTKSAAVPSMASNNKQGDKQMKKIASKATAMFAFVGIWAVIAIATLSTEAEVAAVIRAIKEAL